MPCPYSDSKSGGSVHCVQSKSLMYPEAPDPLYKGVHRRNQPISALDQSASLTLPFVGNFSSLRYSILPSTMQQRDCGQVTRSENASMHFNDLANAISPSFPRTDVSDDLYEVLLQRELGMQPHAAQNDSPDGLREGPMAMAVSSTTADTWRHNSTPALSLQVGPLYTIPELVYPPDSYSPITSRTPSIAGFIPLPPSPDDSRSNSPRSSTSGNDSPSSSRRSLQPVPISASQPHDPEIFCRCAHKTQKPRRHWETACPYNPARAGRPICPHEHCRKELSRGDSLQRHLKRVHGEE